MTPKQLDEIIGLCFPSKKQAAKHVAKESGKESWCTRNFLHYQDGRPIPIYVSELMSKSLRDHKRDVDRLSKSVKMS